MRAPYSSSTSECSTKPLTRPISFIQGDEFNDVPYLIVGRVLTPERPEGDDGHPMFHESETVPSGVTASSEELVGPWEERHWFGDIRSSFLSTVRYYNGWVPWYGTRPSRVWWGQMSLGAQVDALALYDKERGLTKVRVRVQSGQTTKLNPGGSYRWSLVSAKPTEWDGPDPVQFDRVETWVRGDVRVAANWTSSVPVAPIGPVNVYL